MKKLEHCTTLIWDIKKKLILGRLKYLAERRVVAYSNSIDV